MSEFVRLDETLPVGIFSLMRAFKHEDSSDPTLVQTAKSCMTNLTSALNFLKTLADILFIFIRDRYQMIPIFSKLANTDLVKILVTVLENFTKLQCIERTLGGNKVSHATLSYCIRLWLTSQELAEKHSSTNKDFCSWRIYLKLQEKIARVLKSTSMASGWSLPCYSRVKRTLMTSCKLAM